MAASRERCAYRRRASQWSDYPVKEVFRTNDPVKLSFAENVLRQAGVEPIILDGETAGTYGGALPFVQRRIMVIDEEADIARSALTDAFEGLDDE